MATKQAPKKDEAKQGDASTTETVVAAPIAEAAVSGVGEAGELLPVSDEKPKTPAKVIPRERFPEKTGQTPDPSKPAPSLFDAHNQLRLSLAKDIYAAMIRSNPNYVGIPNDPWFRAAFAHADGLINHLKGNLVQGA